MNAEGVKKMPGGAARIGLAFCFGVCFGLSAVAVTCREDCWSIEDGDGAYVADGAELDLSDGRMSVTPHADRFVLKYAFHPGARPKAGAVRLELVTRPAFAGAVRADLKCIGRQGTTNVVARRVADRHVFDLWMPRKESWQLTQLAFSEAGVGDRRPFAVESVRWCAEGTSAEAFRLLPKRRADGLPLFFPEGGDIPGFVVENSADIGQEWSVCVSFTNRQGRFLSRTERIALPSGGRCRLDVPELRSCRGLWLAEATVRAADGTMARRTARIGVLDPNPVAPRLPDGKFRMGVNFHMGREGRSASCPLKRRTPVRRSLRSPRAGLRSTPARPTMWSRLRVRIGPRGVFRTVRRPEKRSGRLELERGLVS